MYPDSMLWNAVVLWDNLFSRLLYPYRYAWFNDWFWSETEMRVIWILTSFWRIASMPLFILQKVTYIMHSTSKVILTSLFIGVKSFVPCILELKYWFTSVEGIRNVKFYRSFHYYYYACSLVAVDSCSSWLRTQEFLALGFVL